MGGVEIRSAMFGKKTARGVYGGAPVSVVRVSSEDEDDGRNSVLYIPVELVLGFLAVSEPLTLLYVS